MDKNLCCGCTACVASCPNNAISMVKDEEGFLYPNISDNLCVHCGLCKRVCPIINDVIQVPDFTVKKYAARIMNDDVRLKSSSGGHTQQFLTIFLIKRALYMLVFLIQTGV